MKTLTFALALTLCCNGIGCASNTMTYPAPRNILLDGRNHRLACLGTVTVRPTGSTYAVTYDDGYSAGEKTITATSVEITNIDAVDANVCRVIAHEKERGR